MNVAFMGTPEFAVPTLRELTHKHCVRVVICQPDKPNRRGNKTVFGAVKSYALANGIEVLQPESVRGAEFADRIASYALDVIVVAAYGKLLPLEILKLPRYGCINVHASLLPKYRGAAPIQWAIINGETVTGVTIMHMSAGLDTGDMIRKRHVPIETYDTYGTLLEKLAAAGADELIIALDDVLKDTSIRIIQNDAEATYAPVIKKETERISWKSTGEDIVNLVRSLNPAPGAYCDFNGKKLKIWTAEVFGKAEQQTPLGAVIDAIPKQGIVVNASESCVVLTEVQLDGGKKMPATEFLKGHDVKKGMPL